MVRFLTFIMLTVLIVDSKQLQSDEDINGFLFENDDNFKFIDLSHASGRKGYGGEICITARHRESPLELRDYQPIRRRVVKDIPLNHLIVPLILVDVSGIVNDDMNFLLQKSHLDFMLNNYFGRLYQPCLIVFKFGWTKYYDEFKRYGYYDANGANTTGHPGISEELAEWITYSYKNVVGIGVDLPAVDPPSFQEAVALKAFTDAGVYVLDNVDLDKYLPESLCTALVSPQKVSDRCTPYRLMAICPASKMEQPDLRLRFNKLVLGISAQ